MFVFVCVLFYVLMFMLVFTSFSLQDSLEPGQQAKERAAAAYAETLKTIRPLSQKVRDEIDALRDAAKGKATEVGVVAAQFEGRVSKATQATLARIEGVGTSQDDMLQKAKDAVKRNDERQAAIQNSIYQFGESYNKATKGINDDFLYFSTGDTEITEELAAYLQEQLGSSNAYLTQAGNIAISQAAYEAESHNKVDRLIKAFQGQKYKDSFSKWIPCPRPSLPFPLWMSN